MSEADDVEAAAVHLIDAFARNERDEYFAAFTPDATFIFHSVEHVLESRAAYEAEYDKWVTESNFRVQSCVSFNRVVTVLGDFAFFTHQSVSHLTTNAGPQTVNERETIIFRKHAGKWLAVHEHLSLLPE